jgi:hypothetical protein
MMAHPIKVPQLMSQNHAQVVPSIALHAVIANPAYIPQQSPIHKKPARYSIYTAPVPSYPHPSVKAVEPYA